MTINIHPESPKNYASIEKIIDLAFGQKDEGELVAQMRKTDDFIPELTFIASIENQIVGHIMYSKIQIIGEKIVESIALAPVSVHPDFQKKEIGKELIKHSLKEAKRLGFESIIVLGHSVYYPKFGFQPASTWSVKCPFEVPDEVFMGLELIRGALEGKAGIVKYGGAFGI